VAAPSGYPPLVALAIDHIFCFVDPGADWAVRASNAGWVLDEGVEHAGQGTRNRCLWLPELYLEFIWLSSRADAENNPVRLDRRADWRTTGACPFGIGLRGQLDEDLRSEFWAYRPPYARDVCIWVHRSNEIELGAPLVFVIEMPTEVVERSPPRIRLANRSHLLAHAQAASVQRVILQTSAPLQALVERVTPRVIGRLGSPQFLQLVLGDSSSRVLKLTDEITLTG
jgi:glyoxalase-like protein